MEEKRKIRLAFSGVAFLIFILVIGVILFRNFIDNPIDTPVRKIIFINLDVDDGFLANVKNEFEKKFNVATEIRKESMNFQQAYNSERQQYDAVKIINLINVVPEEDERVFAFTSQNIYSGELSFVFSSADKEKNIGVISTYYLRLKLGEELGDGRAKVVGYVDNNLLVERTMKTLLRMFGGTMGFATTFNKDCVMAFSDNLNDLDRKGTEFCGKQKEHLKKLGMLNE